MHKASLTQGTTMNSLFTFMKQASITLCSLVLISMNVMATGTAPVDKIVDAIKPALIREQNLASLLPNDEVLWLENESGKFLALKRDYLAATHRGVAIFISDLSTAVNHNLDIEPIRTNINQYGWTSLSINPPSISLLNPPPKKEIEKPLSASDSAPTMAALPMQKQDSSVYAKALIERIISAQEWAKSHSKNTILVIQGRQVAYLTDALMQQHLHPLKAIVLLDANGAMTNNNPTVYPWTMNQLSKMISQLRMPVLDIYHLRNDRTKAQLLKRKHLSVKEKNTGYRQFLKSTYSEEQQLAKVIYGWMKTLDN